MEIVERCERIAYQGRCTWCGSLIELDEKEYKDVIFTCPHCGRQTILKKGTIARFFVSENGKYTRG